MNILHLCNRVPFPPTDGGSFAIVQLQRALTENGARVDMLSFNTVKHHVSEARMKSQVPADINLETVPLDNRVKVIPAFLNLFGKSSYNIDRFISKDFERSLLNLLEKKEYDVIIFDSLFMTPYADIVRNNSAGILLLRAHNVEHQIWSKLADSCKNPIKRMYLRLLAKRLKNYELKSISKMDAVAAISEEDAAFFKNHNPAIPVHITPAGIDAKAYNLNPDYDPNMIVHLGSMDWQPNREGLKWFYELVWPLILKAVPKARLLIGGKNMPADFFKWKSDAVEVFDFVPDAKSFINRGGIVIIPLLSGSGMRIKLIESMALGKAIVSTRQGAEGIPVENEKELILADRPEDFASAVIRLINEKESRDQLGKLAMELVKNRFNNRTIGTELIRFLQLQQSFSVNKSVKEPKEN